MLSTHYRRLARTEDRRRAREQGASSARRTALWAAVLCVFAVPTRAADSRIRYGRKGLEMETEDGNFKTNLSWRLQLRYSLSQEDDPRTTAQFDTSNENSFRVRRARIKLDGNAYKQWLRYKLEYDFPTATTLDARVSLERDPRWSVRMGQWKIEYNRERVDSSGEQQFSDRSIVNREFTVDRQQGVMAYGRLFNGSRADMSYFVGVFNGMGPNAANDDSIPLYMGRLQWNLLGRVLGFSQSDVTLRRESAASLAFAAASDQSSATRFSSSGPGALDGFTAGSPGRYAIKQWMQEAAWHYGGMSLQQEYHWKQIRDNSGGRLTRMEGAYVQAGAFPHAFAARVPAALEVAARYAFVDPDRERQHDIRQEQSLALNWFIDGHRNKITLDATHFTLARVNASIKHSDRLRLQWDLSF